MGSEQRPMRRRGMRADQLELAAGCRALGMTWAEIAAVFRDRYDVNALVAMRLAHGWSQRDAAERWNRCWPDDPKTFKTFSGWENWPGPSGNAPSLGVLARLAELYQCAVIDLLVDAPDFRRRDPNEGVRPLVERAPAQRALAVALESALSRLADADVEEVAAAGLLWAERIASTGQAYPVLMKLSAGLALAATAREALDPGHPLSPAATSPPAPVGSGRDGEGGALAGIWHSRQRGPLAGEHVLVLRAGDRGRLVGQSLPHPAGARLRLDLALDGQVVSGSWAEHMAGGRSGYGTVRFHLDPSRRRMRGRWLAFGARSHVLAGDWELTWQQATVTGRTLPAYRSAA